MSTRGVTSCPVEEYSQSTDPLLPRPGARFLPGVVTPKPVVGPSARFILLSRVWVRLFCCASRALLSLALAAGHCHSSSLLPVCLLLFPFPPPFSGGFLNLQHSFFSPSSFFTT